MEHNAHIRHPGGVPVRKSIDVGEAGGASEHVAHICHTGGVPA